MKVQEGSVLKCLNFRIFQSPLGFSIDQIDQITELVNEWFPAGTFRNVDTPFRKDSPYEKELLAALPLTGHALHKAYIEYHGNFGQCPILQSPLMMFSILLIIRTHFLN